MRLLPITAMLIASVLLLSSLVFAEDWKKLKNDEITSALTEKEVLYTDQGSSSQTFYKNGETGFVSGRPSQGYWRVDGNQFCSQWPPSSTWACYDVYLNTAGTIVRFRGSDDIIWDGTYK